MHGDANLCGWGATEGVQQTAHRVCLPFHEMLQGKISEQSLTCVKEEIFSLSLIKIPPEVIVGGLTANTFLIGIISFLQEAFSNV